VEGQRKRRFYSVCQSAYSRDAYGYLYDFQHLKSDSLSTNGSYKRRQYAGLSAVKISKEVKDMRCRCADITHTQSDIDLCNTIMSSLSSLSSKDSTQANGLRSLASSVRLAIKPANSASLTTQIQKEDNPIANDRESLYQEISRKRDTLKKNLTDLKTEDKAYHKAQTSDS